jgi:hypothetical protein
MSKLEYFVKVNEVPEREYREPSIASIIIKEFLEQSSKIVKLKIENIRLKAPYAGLRDCLRDNKISNIKVIKRGTDIYLEKI